MKFRLDCLIPRRYQFCYIAITVFNILNAQSLYRKSENPLQILICHNFFWISTYLIYQVILLKMSNQIRNLLNTLQLRISIDSLLTQLLIFFLLKAFLLITIHIGPFLFFIHMTSDINRFLIYMLIISNLFILNSFLVTYLVIIRNRTTTLLLTTVAIFLPIAVHRLLINFLN